MSTFEEIILGHEAIDYIRKCLSTGLELTLSNYILGNIVLEDGQVTTVLPKEANLKEINNFESGILPNPPESEWTRYTWENGRKAIGIPVTSFYPHVVEAIRLFLKKDSRRLCVFEQAMAKPNSQWLKRDKLHYITFKDEVYYFLTGEKYTDNEIEQAIMETGHAYPPLMCSMTSLTSIKRISEIGTELTTEVLKEMGQNTEAMAIGAYDGEGFLIWNRRSSHSFPNKGS